MGRGLAVPRVGHGLGPSMDWVGLGWVGSEFFLIFGGLGWIGWRLGRNIPMTFQCYLVLPGACSVFRAARLSQRDFSSEGRTVTDARSQLSANTVESVELLKWGLYAGLL